MMAEEKYSGGPSKSRTVLGDLTNRIGKRRLSGREKNEIKSSDFSEKEAIKRICVSPSPCTENNSLKGNVISGISKVPDEIRNPDVSGFGSTFPVSKNSIGSDNDCDGGYSLKGNNILMGNSKVHEGNNGDEILFLKGEDVVLQSVNQSDVDNGLIESSAQIEYSKDDGLQKMDKIAFQNCIDPNLSHLEEGKAVNSITTEADGCGKLDEPEENMVSRNVGVVNEDKSPSLENSVTKSAVDPKIPGSSKNYNEGNDPKMFDLRRDNATIIEAHDESGGSLLADTLRTVSESGNDSDGKNCEENVSLEGSQSEIRYDHNDMDDHYTDNFVLSQSGSIEFTVQSESLKEDECDYMSGKDCSCSFCTEVAYMWLDINYQDMKARLSVMKKSQKDASILAERSSKIKVTDKNCTESSTRVSKLESHLIYQWRSLFQRTAEIWENEGNQLEASLLPLTELREKCKTDLESINAKRTEEH